MNADHFRCSVRSALLILVIGLISPIHSAPAEVTQPAAASAPPVRMIVAFERDRVQTLGMSIRKADPAARIVKRFARLNSLVVLTSDPRRFARRLGQVPGIRYVERDRPVRAADLPVNDPLILGEMCHALIGLIEAWSGGNAGAGTTIAIVDTGVDASHPDLKDRMMSGRDLVDDDDVADDEHGHGTHVAGIAAATAGNGEGVAGVAHDASIMPVRVLDAKGNGWTSDVAEGVRWAADQHATVVNLSLGSPEDSRLMRDAIHDAVERGTSIVCAAGNDAADTLLFPAAYEDCLAVGAIDPSTLAIADFSNHGAELDLVAGGVSIISSVPYGIGYADWYERFSGTSMAAPHVAGAVAVLRGAGITSQDVGPRLKDAALDLGAPGTDTTYGAGLLDVGGALDAHPSRPRATMSAWTRERRTGTRIRCGSVPRPCVQRPKARIRISGATAPARYVRGRNLVVIAEVVDRSGQWKRIGVGRALIRATGTFDSVLPARWTRRGRLRLVVHVHDTSRTKASRIRELYFQVTKSGRRGLQPTADELGLIDCINDVRAARGLTPMVFDQRLASSARWLAHDMATHDYLSHTDRRGRAVRERLTAYRYPTSTWVGEVLAAGSATPVETLDLWRTSQPHWAILTSARYVAAGIGHSRSADSTYRDYWAVDVGSTADASKVVPPASGTCSS